jgi:hypothetical protein
MGIVIASFAAIGLMLFPVAGATFSGMFKDVGAGKDLPLLTKLATSAWFPLLLVLPIVACLALGLRRKSPLVVRRAWIVGAFALGCVSFALCLVGMYLPVFAIANAVRAE